MTRNLIITAFGAGIFMLASQFATPADAQCVWRGTAPACAGECKPNEILRERRGGGLITPFGGPGEPPYGSNCITGTKALCCPRCPSGLVWREAGGNKFDVTCVTPAQRDGEDTSQKSPKPVKKLGKAKAPPPEPQSPKPVKKLGKAVQTACANNDVDVYDSPVEPRSVTGMMAGGAKAKILQRHEHGWWKMDGYGWVARDHLSPC